MTARIIVGDLKNLRFFELDDGTCCTRGPKHELPQVPVLPGGTLEGTFSFESKLISGKAKLAEPRIDAVWTVKRGRDSFVAGAFLQRTEYLKVIDFDRESGRGTALIKIPFLSNYEFGFPPLFPGNNEIELILGLEGELFFDNQDQIYGVEHRFAPIKISGTVPEYSVVVSHPELFLDDESCKADVFIYARDAMDKVRTAKIAFEFDPVDPCGVLYPSKIEIPPNSHVGSGTIHFTRERCGNNFSIGRIRAQLGNTVFTSLPIVFDNTIWLQAGTAATKLPITDIDNWAYCQRNVAGDMRATGTRTTTGPCETGPLTFYTCPTGVRGFYFPHKCSFAWSTDCVIYTKQISVPGWNVTRSFSRPCRTLVFIKDKPHDKGGGWRLKNGSQVVCIWAPIGRNVNITVEDCQTV